LIAALGNTALVAMEFPYKYVPTLFQRMFFVYSASQQYTPLKRFKKFIVTVLVDT
jgi:hypothetical protein